MYSKNDSKITLLRNETSLIVDDLIALVANSALAYQLREFSSEIMDLTPGFTFNLSQAKNLRDLSRRTYKQYISGTISDVELMNFQGQAYTILKGDNDTVQSGGKQMGIFDKSFRGINKLIHGKEIKKQEALAKLELDYQHVCKEIMTCQEKMDRCVKESCGHAPDSEVYRKNQRTFTAEKNRLTLLRKKETDLRRFLEEADRIQLIDDFVKWQEEFGKKTGNFIGNEEDLIKLETKAQIQGESNTETIGRYENFGQGILSSAQEDVAASQHSDDFAASVATRERQQTQFEFAGVAVDNETAEKTGADDEFGSLVRAKGEE